MWPYGLLLAAPVIASFLAFGRASQLLHAKTTPKISTRVGDCRLMVMFAVILALMVGLRHEVGGDWLNYLPHVDAALEMNWKEGLRSGGDPAYGLLTWLSAHLGLGIYGVNLICAAVFTFGLLVFARNSPQPWLVLSVAVPYLVIVVAMGYTRQGVAIGLAMVGLVALHNGRLWTFALWLFGAALFHKSALILVPLAVFAGRKSWIALLGVLTVGVLMVVFLLLDYVDNLVAGYITDQYVSSGAHIRVAMNALPATIFIVLRKRFGLTDSQQAFWTWMSLGALAFIPLLAISPSSTAVDRVALYWIPLQLFVWPRLPQAMGLGVATQRQWLTVVLSYTVAVQFVWLFFADYSWAWIPYRFYPLEWLWS
jgi:hypothetical protein